MNNSETNSLAIRARGLTKHFGSVHAVNGLDLDVTRSRIFGFLGPNGSGKSTTIRMLCGLLIPTDGEIAVLGHQVPRDAEALKHKVGYMTQKFSLFTDLSVSENLRFMADIYSLPGDIRSRRIGEAVERYELGRFMKQMAGTLSGGQKQRLALAASMLHKPELLFLDEPTSAVDPENRRAFWEILFDLAAEDTTILVSTHYMDEAERCHDIAILDLGVLVAAGTPAQLAADINAQIVVVESDTPRKVSKLLETRDFVHSTAQIGSSLRVLVDRELDNAAGMTRRAVTDAGLELHESKLVKASLEDVFVAATQERKAQRDAA